MENSNWRELEEKLQPLQGSNILVTYDIGHGNAMVASTLEEVGPDFLKLAGHYPLGFIETKAIRHGGEIIFPIQKEA